MSKLYRMAVAAALIAALTFLASSAVPTAFADSDGGAAKVVKKSKSKPDKKPDDKKAKAGKKYDDFADEESDEDQPAVKTETKTAKEVKKAEKAIEHVAAKVEKAIAAKHAEKVRTTIVRFTLSGEYPEGASEGGMFAAIQPSLSKLLDRINEAKADKEVSGVWLRIGDMELGRGKVNEVCAAIAAVRKAGKPVYAELTSADSGSYLVAAACDYIYMPSSGVLMMPGVRLEMTYYKGLLDKLGLKFESLQMGKFKGAAEPMSRSTMSAPLRESLQSLVDDAYDDMVAAIAKDRKLPEYTVKSLIDQGLFSAAAAKDAGLIDDVMYADQFESSLAERLKVAKVDVDASYKKEQVDTDFSGLGGFVKLMEAISGGKKSSSGGGSKQKIAVVYAVGEIVEGKSTSSMFGGSSLGSVTMIENIHKAFEDPKVVAVVLRIDSPGGSATASDLIWRETVRHNKPFVASMGNVAGSGGYYIAMGAKKIFAEPGTITGSIGVVGGKLVTGGLYDKVGMNTEIISRGKNSGVLSSTNPFTPDERKIWMKLMEETYHEFVGKAAAGRKMPFERVQELAQGRVYTGRQAKKLGLIDEIGTLNDAIAEAKKMAGLKPGADVDLLVLPQPKSVFEQLLGGDGGETEDFTAPFTAGMPEFVKSLRHLQVWKQLLGGKVMLWMPYHVELK